MTFVLPTYVFAAPPPRINAIDGLIRKALDLVLPIAGVTAVAMLVYGGFMFMLSSGDPQKVQQSRNVITWTIVGIIVLFSFTMIVRFVFNALLIS